MDMPQQQDNRWFIDNWQHVMGSLDEMLNDARGNTASIEGSAGKVGELLKQAEGERAAAEAALHTFEEHRQQLATTLDALQRELAVAGVPLRGVIS